MDVQYHCEHPRRLAAVRDHATLNGIDYLEVLDRDAIALGLPRQRTLLVRVVKPLPAVAAANVEIEGGVRVRDVRVEWARPASEAAAMHAEGILTAAARDHLLARPDPEALLVVRTDREGDYSSYRLRLVEAGGDATLVDFDRLLSEICFSFKVECPSDFDCAPEDECPPEIQAVPPIDYLAKDYASFRQLLLDRLSVVLPDWRERSPADLGVTLVELLAYVGDRLSYHQDAVAAEAYLGTARLRPSVRRHARLLDYPMHDGCNARTWVAVTVEEGVSDVLLARDYLPGRRTRLLTRVPGRGVGIAEEEMEEVLAEHAPLVFEPLHDLRLYRAHNEIRLYTWGDEECCLPRGATRATLVDDAAERLRLRPGDVLVFEEVIGTATGAAADADPARRHAVRLTRVTEPAALVPGADEDEPPLRAPGSLHTDALFDRPIVEVEWGPEDALPFPLCLSKRIEIEGETVLVENISVGRGNVLLADHGRLLAEEELPTPSGGGRYRPYLAEPEVTRRVPFGSQAWEEAGPGERGFLSATAALAQQPRAALPDVELADAELQDWEPKPDLLASGRFETEFVVELENDGRAALRFGDGIFGRRPEAGVAIRARYRVGSGPEGNVGAGAIAHLVSGPGLGVERVGNPLPAVGGTAPEPLDDVRHYAPQAFRRQERAVTEADYAEVAERHPEVSRAVARRLWTGSWHTMFVTVDRVGGRPVDRAFEEELVDWIDGFKLAGHDVEVEPPRFVPLDIVLKVCVEPGHLRSAVKESLLRVFGRHDHPGGRGFFHPDELTFGQPVYLSRIIATAMRVPGVRWVEIDPSGDPPGRFRRWGEKARGEIEQGYIGIGRLEVARLDNDTNRPENGKIEFHMEGGL